MMKPNPPERPIRGRDILLTLPFVLVSLVLLEHIFPEMAIWLSKHMPVNRWYRAAGWAAWLFCALEGVMLIGMAVTWGMARPPLGQASDGLGGLQLAGIVAFLVAFCVIGGLLAIGYIAQGNQETREFARAWGRTKGKVIDGSTPEDSHPA